MIYDLRFLICNLTVICVRRAAVRALLLGLLCCLADDACAETLLRWKFNEGQQWRVTVDQHTVTQTSGVGKPTGIDIKMQLVMSWTVDSVDTDGTVRMTQSFERFAVTMKSAAAEAIEYASDSPTKPSGSAEDIAAAVERLIGADFTVTMTNRGAIREVTLSDAAAEAFSSVESPALSQLFSVEGISQLLRQAAAELPEQAVAAGSEWTTTFAAPSPLGALEQTRSYTVAPPQDVDGRPLQQIKVTGQLEIKGREESPSQTKLVDQELTGTMSFDVQAGRLVTSHSTQKLTTERPYREFKIRVDTTASTTTTISAP